MIAKVFQQGKGPQEYDIGDDADVETVLLQLNEDLPPGSRVELWDGDRHIISHDCRETGERVGWLGGER